MTLISTYSTFTHNIFFYNQSIVFTIFSLLIHEKIGLPMIGDFFYIFNHNVFFGFSMFTFSYISIYLVTAVTKLIYKISFYCQLIVINNLRNYVDCLLLLVDNKNYQRIYVSLTNLNLKNYFILSGFCLYIFYLLNLVTFILIPTLSNTYLMHSTTLFYLNYNFSNCLKLQIFVLFGLLTTIIIHASIGLYMLCFDYLKNSALILWTLILYVTILLLILYLLTINV